jgi:hypothetical protein
MPLKPLIAILETLDFWAKMTQTAEMAGFERGGIFGLSALFARWRRFSLHFRRN